MSAIAAVAAALVTLVAAPASAKDVQKVRYPATLGDHVALPGMCDFTVYATDTGTPPMITETWVDGNLVRMDITPRGTVYTTLEANGNTYTQLNNGPVTLIFNDDGTITVYQRGASYTADQGLITGDAFFWQYFGRGVTTAVPNPDTGFVDFIDVSIVGHVTDVCDVLA
jgi:hypothetical protein